MNHKLTRKLVTYFSIVLLLFALIIGCLFTFLFMRHTSNLHKAELKNRAVSIANTLSSMPEYEEHHSQLTQQKNMMAHGDNGTAMMKGYEMKNRDDTGRKHFRTYDAYLHLLNEIAMSEVWIVDEQARTIDLYGSRLRYSYDELPNGAEELIDKVFAGHVESGEDFSSLLGEPSVTVGAPIRDSNGNVQAALLLHRTIKGMNEAELDGMTLLAACLITALLLAAGLSVVLASHFIEPLRKMETTATRLMEKDYTARTGITQNDEIGSLAQNIDELALRLAEAEKESMKLEQMRRDFITNISHELRTPITVLRGSLEVLENDFIKDPEERREYLQQMLSDTIHLQRLVNDLLELSRLQNTDFKIDKTRILLNDVLDDAVHAIRHLAEKKDIVLTLDGDLAPFSFEGDYGRLRQMFVIVLDNAVKFSPTGKSIHASIQQTATSCTICIKDNGCGIPSEDLPHIFERFYRTHSQNNTSGTGLGLAIAKHIADRHGIRLSCKSEIGKFTIFEFVLKK
jgi:signal transduction histidine kinase